VAVAVKVILLSAQDGLVPDVIAMVTPGVMPDVTVIVKVQLLEQFVTGSVYEYVMVCAPIPAVAGSKLPALTPVPL
jgi:hypothetical protein